MEDVMKNADKLCEIVKGVKIGLPGMDMIVFPEYSTMVRTINLVRQSVASLIVPDEERFTSSSLCSIHRASCTTAKKCLILRVRFPGR